MKTKIELDLKSLALGAAAAALVIFATGANIGSAANTGPYVLKIGATGAAAVVNTNTGQVWPEFIRPSDGAANGHPITDSWLHFTSKKD